jgi:hypothetical protein
MVRTDPEMPRLPPPPHALPQRSWRNALGEWPSPEQRSSIVVSILLALFCAGIAWLAWALR